MSLKKVAFYHGLESKSVSSKSEYLKSVLKYAYCPAMNYDENGLFEKELIYLEDHNFELLIGSSMGGWFALALSSLTGIPTLTFNPAIHSRTLNPVVRFGNMDTNHKVVLGKNDDLINPEITQSILRSKQIIGHFSIIIENNGHRTPLEIFKKHVEQYIHIF